MNSISDAETARESGLEAGAIVFQLDYLIASGVAFLISVTIILKFQ